MPAPPLTVGDTLPGVAKRVADTLVAHGFAEVAAVQEGERLFVRFENATYRDEQRALREVASLVLAVMPPGIELVLVPTKQAIPLLMASYPARPREVAEAPEGDPHPPLPPPRVWLDAGSLPPALRSAPRASSSFGRLDVVVHPWFEAQFGDFDNPVASRTGLGPEFRVTLRPGLRVRAQALVTLQDDLPTGESRVRPGMATLNQTLRLPHNLFVSATAGTFTQNRYGVDLESRLFFRNGSAWVGAEVGRTGTVSYAREGWFRTPVNASTALGEAGWRSARHDLVLRATGGVFLDRERGVRLDAVRQLGELEVGWFVVRSAEGSNGGMTLRIPLLPSRYTAPGPVRVRTAEAFRWQYRYRGVVPGGRRYTTGNTLEEMERLLDLDRLREGGASGGQQESAPLREEALSGPALTGTTGLVTIPTAGMPADGSITMGANVIDREHHGYRGTRQLREHPGLVQYASVGFLPFVEVALRLTRVLDVPRQALGDRTVSVRVRVLEEGRYTPAVVVGVHDLVGTRIFHAEYVTASKRLPPLPLLGTVGLHAGYGGDWLSLRAKGRQFVGAFGGVSVAPRPWAVLLVEHDSEQVNTAVRLRFRRFTLLGAAHGSDGISGGISYSIQQR